MNVEPAIFAAAQPDVAAPPARPKRKRRVNPVYREPVTLSGTAGILPQRAPEVRTMPLWDLVIWTYRDQLAHRLLQSQAQWVDQLVSTSSFADGETPRARVHPDAAAIHAAVGRLVDPMILVTYAVVGAMPDYPIGEPRPRPVTRADRCEAKWKRDGEVGEYAVLIAEQVAVDVPSRRGKAYRREIREVEYCPIRWWPDPAWLAAERAYYDRWQAALEQLLEALRGVELRQHRVAELASVYHL
jgi:hypothetical protein